MTEGQSATLHASLSNTSAEEMDGSVIFADDGKEFGKVALTLAEGEARIISVSWKPSRAATHSLTATLVGTEGELDKLTIAVVVAEKPKTEAQARAAAAIESSAEIQKKIAELSPQVGKKINPVFDTLDDARERGAVFLDREIADTKSSLDTVTVRRDELAKGSVAGAETDAARSESRKLTAEFFFKTLLLYTLSAVRFAVGNAGLFYPLVAVIVLTGLYKLFMRWRNPVRYSSDI